MMGRGTAMKTTLHPALTSGTWLINSIQHVGAGAWKWRRAVSLPVSRVESLRNENVTSILSRVSEPGKFF